MKHLPHFAGLILVFFTAYFLSASCSSVVPEHPELVIFDLPSTWVCGLCDELQVSIYDGPNNHHSAAICTLMFKIRLLELEVTTIRALSDIKPLPPYLNEDTTRDAHSF